MKVLVACEESQAVCKAFRERGHEAYSCDIQEPSGGHPEWHILGDALEAMRGGQITTMDGQTHDIPGWDLMIAHPPCTYLSNLGSANLRKHGIINPILMATDIVVPTGKWVETTHNGRASGNWAVRGHSSAKNRSKSFPGIARAMAEQWG